MLINVQASIILYWILLAYLNAYAIMPSSVGSTFNPGQADCHEAKVGDALIQMGLTHLSCVCVGVWCVCTGHVMCCLMLYVLLGVTTSSKCESH